MKFFKHVLLVLAVLFTSWGTLVCQVAASSETTMEVAVTWIIEEKTIQVLDKTQPYQKLKFLILSGPEKGQEVVYEHGLLPASVVPTYKVGDKLILGKSTADSGESSYYIMDVVRRPSLYALAALFVGLVVAVARMKAVRALIALILSFVAVFWLVLPQILKGTDPILTALAAALFIIPVTFYLSHGMNKKTHVAIAGTFVALLITGLLARVFVDSAKLTGFSSEEAAFLQATRGANINIKGLLLAGMIIGILGILDDVTVSQAVVVKELAETDQSLTGIELFRKAMRVGTDHIASMINTLVLVYAGAAMPLLLLFLDTPKPVTELINYEMVAEEIIRMLVGSIGLVLAVPLTTLLAVKVFVNKPAVKKAAVKQMPK